jgi:ribosomal-protein-alanine acetyltransferase
MDQLRWGGLVVRDAARDDLDAIVTLENDSFPEDRVSRRTFAYHLRAPDRTVIVATVDRALAGYVLNALRKTGRTMRIYTIAVDPRFGRRGIGTALLAAAEKLARRHGRQAVTLEVRYDNARAIALYEKCGYRLFGEHEDYYADGATALRYRKTLDHAPPGAARSRPSSPRKTPARPA